MSTVWNYLLFFYLDSTFLVVRRKQKCWTQEELGNRSGIGRVHVVRIEQGKYDVRIDTLAAIADAFGMTVDFVKKKKE